LRSGLEKKGGGDSEGAGRNAACSQDGNFHRFSNLSATGAFRTHFCITRAFAPNASRSPAPSGPNPRKPQRSGAPYPGRCITRNLATVSRLECLRK
jgi:hypothetical protein